MSSLSISDASAASVTLAAPEVQTGETLLGSACGDSVLEILVEGSYGRIPKCQNLETKETAAVKIHADFIQDTEKETSEEYTAENDLPEEHNSLKELPSSVDDVVNMQHLFKEVLKEMQLLFQHEDSADEVNTPGISNTAENNLPEEHSSLTELPSSVDDMVNMEHLFEEVLTDVQRLFQHEDSADQMNIPGTSEPDQESDTGFCDNTPATTSSDEDTPSDCCKNYPTDNSDRDSLHSLSLVSVPSKSVFSLNDRDPDPWSSGVIDLCSSDEDSASCSSDGLDLCSGNKDSATCSSDGATETDSTASTSSGRSTKLLKRIQRFFRGIRETLCCCWHPSVED